ncbi:MAG: TraB/GumN family protein [Steroidobacteraceae bacterium]
MIKQLAAGALWFLLSCAVSALADDQTPAEMPRQEVIPDRAAPPTHAPVAEPIDEVVVSGEQPGPSLWKVSKGDHVMWVLGTLSPLPRKMTWRSREAERVIEQAQEIIAQESIDPDIGFFRSIRLLPAALRARQNPDGAQLKDVLEPELYARWSRLKALYIGNDDGVEKWRPLLAGFKLYSEALERSGLEQRQDAIWPVIRKLARKHDVPIKEPRIEVKVKDPRGLIRDFTESSPERDLNCFTATLDRIETDLEPMKQRASAWAVGDIETLQRLQSSTQQTVCLDALAQLPRLKEEIDKVRTLAFDKWMATAESALARNDVTLAVLPMDEVLSPTGRLAQLRDRGYVVKTP